MEISLDLAKVTDKASLFESLDDQLIINEWGHNWDALNDCLHDLDTGGFTQKYNFPLLIKLINWNRFAEKNPNDFKIFQTILEDQSSHHKNYGNVVTFLFK